MAGLKNIIFKVKKILEKLPETTKWKFWIIVALIVKSILYLLKFFEERPLNKYYLGSFGIDGADTYSYILPIENLIKSGIYFDDYRMPGYGALYYILRIIFNQTYALNSLVIIQVILSAISVYVLAEISLKIFKKKSFFYLTFFIYLISTFVSLYDRVLLTESLCTSSLIFSIYFLLKDHSKKQNLLLSGLFLTWSIFLKPVISVLMIFFCIYTLVKNQKLSFSTRSFNWRHALLLILPFILVDGIWMVRNYKRYEHIYPLTKSIYFSGTEESYLGHLISFMQATGGSYVWWEPGSAITFYIPAPDFIKKKINVLPPPDIYTSKFNFDSLFAVKSLIEKMGIKDLPAEKNKIMEKEIIDRLDRYTLSIKIEKPYLYYVGSRLSILKNFFVNPGTYNLLHKASFELNMVELLIKVFYSGLYALVIILGFLGIFWLGFLGIRELNYLFIFFIGTYLALVFPLILKMDEFRYFVPGYPIFLISGIFAIDNLYHLSKNIIKTKLKMVSAKFNHFKLLYG